VHKVEEKFGELGDARQKLVFPKDAGRKRLVGQCNMDGPQQNQPNQLQQVGKWGRFNLHRLELQETGVIRICSLRQVYVVYVILS
jgi:hypothetical protein